MLFIYYPKCSTCIKAMKHLKTKNIDIEKRDIIMETPTQDELIEWMKRYDQGIKPFFNTAGVVYREMGLKNKINDMNIEEAAQLLSCNGMLIKRPILVDDNQIIIGYKKEIYDSL